jgi:heat shock protein HslJ
MKNNTVTGGVVLVAAIAVLIGGGLIAAGCSSDDDPNPLLYATWQLQEFVLDDGTTVTVDDPTKYTVELRTDHTTTIRSDCNTCSGSFSADDKDLSFGLLACTLAACPSGSLDTQFQTALGSVSSYTIDTSLFLDYEGGVMRLLAPVATPLQ